MPTILALVVIAALLLAAYVVGLNWFGALASLHSRRKGSPRNFSLVPLVAQMLVIIAALSASRTTAIQVPNWIFWLVALADLALWQLLYLPIFLWKNRKSQT